MGVIANGRHSWMICEWSRTQHWRGGISYRSFSGYGVVGESTAGGHTRRSCSVGSSLCTQPNSIRYLSSHSAKSSAIVLGGRPNPLLHGLSSIFPVFLQVHDLVLVVLQVFLEGTVPVKALVPLVHQFRDDRMDK